MKRFLIKFFGLHGKAHIKAEADQVDALIGMGL